MEINHVLIVEDDKEIREGVQIYLQSQGYVVFQHHNCGTCRQKQDQNKNSKFTAVFRFCIQRPTPPSNILDFSGRSRSSPEYFLHAP